MIQILTASSHGTQNRVIQYIKQEVLMPKYYKIWHTRHLGLCSASKLRINLTELGQGNTRPELDKTNKIEIYGSYNDTSAHSMYLLQESSPIRCTVISTK